MRGTAALAAFVAAACRNGTSPRSRTTTPTARTSPYEYVTTVIYPGCAIKKGEGANPPDWETKCGTTDKNTKTPYQGDTTGSKWAAIGQRGGTWSRDCAGPYCFGVPIYRQYLTGTKITDKGKTTTASTREWKTWADKKCDDNPNSDDCDFPFARMSGGFCA
jgi:hypothetical protein